MVIIFGIKKLNNNLSNDKIYILSKMTLYGLFSRKQPTLYDQIMKSICEDFTSVCKDVLPSIEEEMKTYTEQKLKDIKKNIDNDLNKEMLHDLIDVCFSKISSYSYGDVGVELDELGSKVETLKKKNKDMVDFIYEEVDMKNYYSKIELAKKYCNIISKEKKTIYALILGDSQQGKSSFVKQLFQISDADLQIKRNLESDTTEVKEYRIEKNGITFVFVDCPGFHDSRGKEIEKRNMKKIIEYINNNNSKIDVIFWVSRLDRILDSAHKDAIEKLTKKYGNDIWSKSIIILTCANSSPIPESYFENSDDSDDESAEEDSYLDEKKNFEKMEKDAWKNYTKDKKNVWKEYFYDHLNSDDRTYEDKMMVCLVENNRRYVKTINGISVLKDGFPFWENLMYKIFKLIDEKKAPIVFMAMAKAKQKKKMDSHDNALDNALNNITNLMNTIPLTKRDNTHNANTNINTNINTSTKNNNNDSGWCSIL